MLVSGRGLASALGVSEGAIRKAAASGRIERDGNGKYDLETARVAWDAHRAEPKPAKAGRKRDEDEDGSDDGTDPGAGTLYRARVVKEVAIGKLRGLEYDLKSGELVEKAIVRKVFFEHSRRVRDAILNMPGRLGAVQAAALLVYLKGVLEERLTPEQASVLSADLDPKAVEAVVADTMTEELRSILDQMADAPPPAIA